MARERPRRIAVYRTAQCPGCFEPIEEGDEIALDEPDGQWMHESCAEETSWDEELDDDFPFYA